MQFNAVKVEAGFTCNSSEYTDWESVESLRNFISEFVEPHN